MKKRLLAILIALLIGSSLTLPATSLAGTRRNVGVSFPAGAYGYSVCPKYKWCTVRVVAFDLAVWFSYAVKIYRYTNYASMSNYIECTSHESETCTPTSYISCSTAGCLTGGSMIGSGGPGYPESIWVYNYENGRLDISVHGTTSGDVYVDGAVVYHWS